MEQKLIIFCIMKYKKTISKHQAKQIQVQTSSSSDAILSDV